MVLRLAHTRLWFSATMIAVLMAMCTISGSAQSNIGGIINIYTPVLQITTDACAALLQVEDTTGFRAGDRVLLHQTMGCTGATDYTVDAVGLFEFATIERVRPNKIIELKRTLVHSYQRCNFVQLIRIPSYVGTTAITTTLRGKPWDGKGGGIIALEVRGVLNFRSGIDASSIGYQGGAAQNSPNGVCSTTVANTTIANPDAAMKGATFVYPRANNVAGSAELFSAGGGGLGHNSGGGGGGNGGNGGNGGAQWQGCGAVFNNGGRGGASLPIQFNGMPYLRFGGGGGAGHSNNTTGSAGGAGGGIVIIKADTIYGNQNVILATGTTALTSGNDGAGGGGAGGCVLISSTLLVGPLHINVNGGQGGNMSNTGLHGPGGGGGGGGVLYSGSSFPSGTTFSADGGASGRATAYSDAVLGAHLSKPGSPGSVAFRAIIPENTTPKPVLGVSILSDTTICPNQSVTLMLRTIGAVSGIEWREFGAGVLGTASTLDVKPGRTTSYVVTITDQTGCQALDTATVSVLEGWKGLVRPLDLGDVFCDKTIDTSIIVVNLGNAPGFVSGFTCPSANVTLMDKLPIPLGARDSIRVRIRVATGNNAGPNATTVNVRLSPCDTIVSNLLTWNRQNRLNTISPRTVTMPQLYSCAAVSSDTTISCTIRGSNGIITDIVATGSVSSRTTLPMIVVDGQSIPLVLRWTPVPGTTRGRAGVVMFFEGCYDTLWVDVDGVVNMPRMSAPDSVSADDVVLCAGNPTVVDVPLVSLDSTTWFVSGITSPGEVSLDVAIGDTLRGTRVVRASVQPSVLGTYAYTVGIRLSPCDTLITFVITGRAIDARLSHADTIPFVQKIIGRKDQRKALFVNSGDVAIDVLSVEPLAPKPFRLLSTRPTVPCTLQPGDSLACDMELLQRYGSHLDSLVLITTNPCQQRSIVVLTSEAYATTLLYMPDITSDIGATEVVPVFMDGRPEIDSSLLDSFRLQIRVLTSDLAVRDGLSSSASWSCKEDDTTTIITINGRWRGGDTIAMIPMQTLLSKSTSTPLMFVETPGFQWVNQPCDVVYRDGSVILGDVCSGRAVRLVSIGQRKAVVVAPNPASDWALIVPDERVVRSPYSVHLFDQLGKLVLAKTCAGQTPIDLNGLNTGLYVVCVSDGVVQTCIPLVKD
jgi:hypothetical protein